jgi:hypothetical protein
MPSGRASIALASAIALAAAACHGGKAEPTGGAPAGAPGTAAPAPVEPATYLGPEIVLASPPRGALLVEGGQDSAVVTVSGQVCDAVHAITDLRLLGGALLPADGGTCRRFEAQQSSRWGLTIVHAEAVNDAGETGYLAQSFVRSPSWFASGSGDPAARAESGVVLQIDASVVDDGDRGTLDDVASVAQAALATLDLDAVIGEARFASPDNDGDHHLDQTSHGCLFWTQHNRATGFEAWKSGPVAHGPITVDALKLEEGGLSARVTVSRPAVPFRVTGNLDSGCLGDAQDTAEGVARADALVLEGRAAVGADAQGRPRVAFPALSATLAGLDLELRLGSLIDWTGLGNLIGDAITAQVRGPIQEAIRQAVQAALDDQLSGILGSLVDLRASLTLPPELNGTELVIEAAVDHLAFGPERAVIGSAVQVRAAHPRPDHLAAAGRGAIWLGGGRPDPSLLAGSPAVLAVKDDALNQLLHAAWLGGAFDLDDLSVVLGLSDLAGMKLSIHPTLPPLLMPRPGDPAAVDLGWGDVAFDATLTSPDGSARVKGFLSIMVTLERLQIDPGGRSFRPAFAPDPEVHVQLTDVNWDRLPATRRLATEMAESLLRSGLPQLLEHAIRSFPLPSLDLRTLGSGLPAAVLSLEEPRIARSGRYQLLGARPAQRP